MEQAIAPISRPNWLRWLPLRQASVGDAEPLFFHHIAKTGGTSLIKALRSMTPRGLAFSEDGNLSAAFVRDLVSRGLISGQFIYGHPQTGAAIPLLGRATIATLLRDPCDQAISSYLHVRTHRTVPDYQLAQALDFREFLLARPYFAMFQAASLHVGIEERPLLRAEDLIDRLPAILAYLREIRFVGTIATADRMLDHLAVSTRRSQPPSFPHRRKSRISPGDKVRMRQQYADLQDHPALATLFEAERTVYDAAREIEAASPWGKQSVSP